MHAFRFFILASVGALLLAGCDDHEKQDTQSSRPDEQAGNLLSLSGYRELDPTWAGSYLSARYAQQTFDWPRAAGFLQQVQREKNGNDSIARRLMLLSMGAGDFNTALEQSRKIKGTDSSGLTEFISLLGHVRDGEYMTARHALDTLTPSPIVTFAKPAMQAWLDVANGKVDLSALQSQPGMLYQRVLIADFAGRPDLMGNTREVQVSINHMPAIAIERMGDIYMRHKLYELAAIAYDAVAKISPSTPNIIAKRKAAGDKTDLPTNVQVSGKIGDARAGISTVLFDLATTFYNEESFETAQLFAQMSLALKPDYDDVRLLVGNLLARNDRMDEAINLYRAIPETNPRYTQIQQQVAQLLTEQDRDSEAIETLNNLLAHAHNRDEKIGYLMQMGDITRENEAFKTALDYYNQIFKLLDNKIDEENWEVLYARGMTLERLKRWDDAEKDLKTALAYRPNHPYLLNYLGYSWADQNINLDEAVKLLLKAVEIVPEDGYVTDSVGWVYYRMGNYNKAIEYLERAVELLPYDPTVNDHLGDAYAQNHRMREARFQWERALNYSEDANLKAAITEKLGGKIPEPIKSPN